MCKKTILLEISRKVAYFVDSERLKSQCSMRLGFLSTQKSLKDNMQVKQAIRKGNNMWLLWQDDEYKRKYVQLQLCRALVRLHLDYCVKYWYFYRRILERIQWKFTRLNAGKLVWGWENSHMIRLKWLGLYTRAYTSIWWFYWNKKLYLELNGRRNNDFSPGWIV